MDGAVAPLLPRFPLQVLFGVAGIVLVLLFLGLRNAWDLVTYMAVQRVPSPEERNE